MSRPPKAGDLIGPYRLLAPLGSGGAASVFRAEGPSGVVAVKILHAARAATDEAKRLEREYATLARFDHPNVVHVFEAGQQDGIPWLAMELVDGCDLGTLVERWESDPPPDRVAEVERIFAQLAEGLAYVHEQGVVHRDLKPQNVLVGKDGRARITDFGVVKDPSSFPTNLTVVGRLVGTVAFMAPEQISGEGVDARADLYALGALLYVMLTGKRPIVADSIAGYLARHLTEAPRPPSDYAPAIPPHLERLCLRLLEKDPARRPPSARAALAALGPDRATEADSLHGRDAALSALHARLGALRRRSAGGVLALLGPEGSGRTRLLAEVGTIAWGLGLPVTRGDAHAPLGEPAAAGHGGDAIVALRRSLAEGPRVLLVDDLDELPEGAGALLTHAARALLLDEPAPLLLVVSAHSNARLTHPLLGSGLPVDEVGLDPLSREALRGLLRDRGLRGGAGAVLARRLHEELGGLPGPVVEQLQALMAARWLEQAPDGSLRPLRPMEVLRTEPMPLPERVREVESAFLRVLPGPERACVEALAVLESPSAVALVAPLAGVGEAEAAQLLASLVRAGQVRAEEDGLHELFRLPSRRRTQVVYESLSEARRGELHRRAAETVQRVFRRRLNAVAEVAAHHLLAAGDPAAAYPLLLLGAQRAARRGEHVEARTLCQKALDARAAAEAKLGPMEAARARRQLYQVLGDALRALGRPEQAADAYAQALLAAQTEGEHPAIGKALASLGLAVFASGRPLEAANQIEDALGILEQGDPTWPEAAHALALVRFDAGNLDGAGRLWAEVAELGAETRNPSAEMNGLWGLALLARAARRPEEAVEHLERAIERGQEGGAPTAFARVLRQRAEQCLADGDWSGAMRIADELDAVGDVGWTGDSSTPGNRGAALPLGQALVSGLRAAVLQGMGETEAAVRAARQCLEQCRAVGTTELGVLAPAVRVLAESGEAAAFADRLNAPGWMPEVPYDTMSLRLSLAALALFPKDPEAAVQLALEVLRRPPSPVPAAAARVDLDAAQVLLRGHHEAQGVALLDRAVSRLHERAHRALLAEAARLRASLPP